MLKIITVTSTFLFTASLILSNLSFALDITPDSELSDSELGGVSGQAGLTIVTESEVDVENSVWLDTHWEGGNLKSGGILALDQVNIKLKGVFSLDVQSQKKGEPGAVVTTLKDVSVSMNIDDVRIGSLFDLDNDWYALNQQLQDPDFLENNKYGISSSLGGISFSVADVDGEIKLIPGGKYGKQGFTNTADLEISGLSAYWHDDEGTAGFSGLSGSVSLTGTMDLSTYELNGVTYDVVEINSDTTVNAKIESVSAGSGRFGSVALGGATVKTETIIFSHK